MPLVYMPAGGPPSSEPYTTYYQVFVGTNGPIGPMFEPSPRFKLRVAGGCPDGTSGTLLIVEGGTAVPWTKPEDIPYDPGKPLPQLGGLFKDGTPRPSRMVRCGSSRATSTRRRSGPSSPATAASRSSGRN